MAQTDLQIPEIQLDENGTPISENQTYDLNSYDDLSEIYLNLDPKYFELNLNTHFIITKYDLVKYPELYQYIELAELDQYGNFYFDHYSYSQKLQIATVYFRRENILKLIKGYFFYDLQKLLNIDSSNAKLNNLINNFSKSYYFDRDPDSKLVLAQALTEQENEILFEVFFFNKNKTTKERYYASEKLITLTDVNLNYNRYTLETSTKRFFLSIFKNWINTRQGAIPFASGYYCSIKDLVQSKNLEIVYSYVKNEFTTFFNDLEILYNGSIHLKDIKIKNLEDMTGTAALEIQLTVKIVDKNTETLNFNIQLQP